MIDNFEIIIEVTVHVFESQSFILNDLINQLANKVSKIQVTKTITFTKTMRTFLFTKHFVVGIL